MIKTFCHKCRALNLININMQGTGRIKMPCNKCGFQMTFDGKNKILFKPKKEAESPIIEPDTKG